MEKTGRCAAVVLLSLFCGTMLLPDRAQAAGADFPKKEVTMIVSMGPGGGRDTAARVLTNTMTKHLGVPMVVQNLPGAGGVRGLMTLYHAAPDGYTIGIGQVADIIDQVIEKRDYDVRKLTYIGRIEVSPSYWFVKGDSPFRSLKDMKAYGKPVRFAAYILTGTSTIMPLIISVREGFPLTMIGGFKSTVDSAMSVIRNEAESFGSGLAGAQAYCRSGQVRPFLNLDEKRSADFPDVPALRDVGHQDLDVFNLGFYVVAPPGVPKATLQVLEAALLKTLADPEFVKKAHDAGLNPAPMRADDLAKTAAGFYNVVDKYKRDIEKIKAK